MLLKNLRYTPMLNSANEGNPIEMITFASLYNLTVSLAMPLLAYLQIATPIAEGIVNAAEATN